MECRKCGACCIAPSISSRIPGMELGKPKNVRCIHLDEKMLCKIFNQSHRPAVCDAFKPDKQFCGSNFNEAIKIFNSLE